MLINLLEIAWVFLLYNNMAEKRRQLFLYISIKQYVVVTSSQQLYDFYLKIVSSRFETITT